MRRTPVPAGLSFARPCAWRAMLPLVVTALVMTWPGVARPHSLAELLEMPLERLLQLQITPRHAALGTVPVTVGHASAFIAGGRP